MRRRGGGLVRKMGYNPAVFNFTFKGVNRMKSIILSGLMAVSLGVFALAPSAARADGTTPTTCKDGTTTTSTGKGTCSGHGGVQKTPKTTTCSDGSTSTSTGKGTCSGHGGVQKATKTAPAAAPAIPSISPQMEPVLAAV